jgi:DNA-binding SARP family transcriptional activator
MAEQTPVLQILALGPPEVHLGECLVTFPTRKTLALLIYLAIEAGLQPRDQLAVLLWPEASPERSHASLRNTLGHLHAALRLASGESHTSYLSVKHQALGLNPEADIDFDLQAVARAYDQARADRSSRTSLRHLWDLGCISPPQVVVLDGLSRNVSVIGHWFFMLIFEHKIS